MLSALHQFIKSIFKRGRSLNLRFFFSNHHPKSRRRGARMYMLFPLGGGSSERLLRTLHAFAEQFWYQVNSKRDPNEGKHAKKPAVLRWTASAHHSFCDEVVGYSLLRGHYLNKFVKLILLRPITLSEYFIYNLFGNKAETCACQSTERWFNHSLRIQPFLLDPRRQDVSRRKDCIRRLV